MTMKRRTFLTSSTLACMAAALGPRLPSMAETGAEGPFKPLRGNVGIFTGSGGTTGWLVSRDAMVVVDSQFPDSAKACLDGLRHRSDRKIDALINTHHHRDHTAGNGVLRPAAVRIVAQENVPGLQRAAATGEKDEPEPIVADTTFKDKWSIDLGSETVRARHYGRGHTGGDCIVHFQNANVVHMGDLIFNRWHPFIDTKAGASMRGWAEALYWVLEEFDDDTLFIFGHGQSVTGTREDLTQQRNYLLAVLDAARKGVRAGKSLDEVRGQESLPGFDDYLAHGDRLNLEASLRAAYAELSTGERGAAGRGRER